MAIVALGKNAQPMEFYLGMNEIGPQSADTSAFCDPIESAPADIQMESSAVEGQPQSSGNGPFHITEDEAREFTEVSC